MPMTSRERVLTALAHEEPDRVPIIVGPSHSTGMQMPVYRGLKAAVGIDAPDEYIYDWPELGTAALDEATYRRLHADVRGVLPGLPAAVVERNAARPPHSPFVDDWGHMQTEIEPGVWHPGPHPFRDATTLEEIEGHPWPDPADPTRIERVRAEAEALRARTCDDEVAVIGAPWLLFPLERAFAMQGLDGFLLNLAMEPEFAEALLRRTAAACMALMEPFLAEVGDLLDIVKIGDDLGTQDSLLMSPEMYRRILKPIHAEYIAFIKARTPAKLFFHSCGDVEPLLDDFVEIGVDVLGPVQASAGKLADFAGLKRRYGRTLVFAGGIDTHRVLPHGTPEEVRAEVRRVIGLLGPGGGYLLGAVHTIMRDVPPANVLAMVDAAVEFGRYPIQA
jgi:uroporphyrinogen decarboxylase